MRRVAVTGWGVIAPNGQTADQFADAVFAGRSAVRALAERSDGPWPTRTAAWVEDYAPRAHFSAAQLQNLDRSCQFTLLAARQALAQAGLADRGARRALDPGRCGIHLGSGMGPISVIDAAFQTFYAEASTRLKPLTVPNGMANAPAAQLALETGFEGANLSYTCACASSAVAIGEALRRIRHNEADVMLAGGCEALLVPAIAYAWDALRTLADTDTRDPAASCKPFSAQRSGLVLGEGACLFVLEAWDHAKARGAHILAELIGYASGSDSMHLTRPTVEGQARAIRRALQDAHITPAAVGYINAHGTATQANDAVEAGAIRSVFGAVADRLPVSSTKAVHGHLMGAAAAVELLVTLMALRRGEVPPTAHLDHIAPDCALDHVTGRARPTPDLQIALSSSFAFGGTSGVLVARRADQDA